MTPTCNHTKLDGHLCGSPAVTGTPLCYYHARILDRALRNPEGPLVLPVLDNPAAVLAALSQLTLAIASNSIDLKRANILLRALSLATRLTTTIAKAAVAARTSIAEPARAAVLQEPDPKSVLQLQANHRKPNRLPRSHRNRAIPQNPVPLNSSNQRSS